MDAAGRAHGEAFGEITPAAPMLAGQSFVDLAMLVEIEIEIEADAATLSAQLTNFRSFHGSSARPGDVSRV